MKIYDKEFLVAVFMDRYIKSTVISIERLCALEESANALYDRVGKIEFRKYANVTPESIREYLKD